MKETREDCSVWGWAAWQSHRPES